MVSGRGQGGAKEEGNNKYISAADKTLKNYFQCINYQFQLIFDDDHVSIWIFFSIMMKT